MEKRIDKEVITKSKEAEINSVSFFVLQGFIVRQLPDIIGGPIFKELYQQLKCQCHEKFDT
jgi:hypothetical protein